jgi:cytochrome P450
LSRDPEEDPGSSLLLERDQDGRPLEEFQLVNCLRQSLVVAMIAPTIVIGSISRHLSEDKALQAELRADPRKIPAAVEEFVRLYVPYRSFSRTVNKTVEISGQVGFEPDIKDEDHIFEKLIICRLFFRTNQLR